MFLIAFPLNLAPLRTGARKESKKPKVSKKKMHFFKSMPFDEE
jgi:hypothetical protein